MYRRRGAKCFPIQDLKPGPASGSTAPVSDLNKVYAASAEAGYIGKGVNDVCLNGYERCDQAQAGEYGPDDGHDPVDLLIGGPAVDRKPDW